MQNLFAFSLDDNGFGSEENRGLINKIPTKVRSALHRHYLVELEVEFNFDHVLDDNAEEWKLDESTLDYTLCFDHCRMVDVGFASQESETIPWKKTTEGEKQKVMDHILQQVYAQTFPSEFLKSQLQQKAKDVGMQYSDFQKCGRDEIHEGSKMLEFAFII